MSHVLNFVRLVTVYTFLHGQFSKCLNCVVVSAPAHARVIIISRVNLENEDLSGCMGNN